MPKTSQADIQQAIDSMLARTNVRANRLRCHSQAVLLAATGDWIQEHLPPGGLITELLGLTIEYDERINPQYLVVDRRVDD